MKRKNKQEQKVWLAASSPGRLPPAIETGGGGGKAPKGPGCMDSTAK